MAIAPAAKAAFFDGVCGHEHIKKQLIAALESRRAGHAYIFEGKTGVGRYTTAAAFARALTGAESVDHPDIVTVRNSFFDDSKSDDGALLIDTIRAMKKDAYIKPYSLGKKVYIVPAADTMNIPAQNSLLKLLEEPPEYCTIILIADNASAFLPTIVSRAAVLRFTPLSEKIVEEYLTSKAGIARDKARLYSVMSGGSIGLALKLPGDSQKSRLRSEVADRFKDLTEGGKSNIYELAKLFRKNKDDSGFMLWALRSVLEDIIKIDSGAKLDILNADKRGIIEDVSKKVDLKTAAALLKTALKYEAYFKTNANYQYLTLCMVQEVWEEIHG